MPKPDSYFEAPYFLSPKKEGDKTYSDLLRVSRKVLRESIGLGEGENVLIMTNPDPETDYISRSLYAAATELGANPVLMYQPTKTQADFRAYALQRAIESNPHVWISISKNKLGKDELALKGHKYRGPRGGVGDDYTHLLMREGLSRAFWSPNIDIDTWLRTADVDYEEMKRSCAKLARLLDRAYSAHITTEAGTDLTIGLKGRKTHKDDGDFSKPGTGGNIPAGEGYISPVNGSTAGRCVFDGVIGTFDGAILANRPVVLRFEDGFVDMDSIEGGPEAEAFRESILKGMEKSRKMGRDERYINNSRHAGEYGTGLNRKAKIKPIMLEAEKAVETIHIAVGSNYDGDADASTHYDNLMREPNVTLTMPGNKKLELMRKGKLFLNAA